MRIIARYKKRTALETGEKKQIEKEEKPMTVISSY
tara:strand:+ start:441 stop:545 length:105 start_codon:yes stop_codon:yes gene_type:complete